MTGEDFKKKLLNQGVVLADLARSLKVSPQALNSKFKARNLSSNFVDSINRIVYESSEDNFKQSKLALSEKPDESGKIDYMMIIRTQLDFIEHLKERIQELENPIQVQHEKRKGGKQVKVK